jgi:hypothetical protein
MFHPPPILSDSLQRSVQALYQSDQGKTKKANAPLRETTKAAGCIFTSLRKTLPFLRQPIQLQNSRILGPTDYVRKTTAHE